VFGLGFGEMVMLAIVLLVVVGPRDLPRLLRTLGQGLNKLRQMSADLRAQSGIDEIIADEGLREDLASLREISRGHVVDALVRDSGRPSRAARRAAGVVATGQLAAPEGTPPDREQEYPSVGCDAYGALSDEELPYLELDGSPRLDDTPQPPPHEPESADPPPTERVGTTAADPSSDEPLISRSTTPTGSRPAIEEPR